MPRRPVTFQTTPSDTIEQRTRTVGKVQPHARQAACILKSFYIHFTNLIPQNELVWVWFMGEDGQPKELPTTAGGKVMKHVLGGWSRDLATKGIGRATYKTSLLNGPDVAEAATHEYGSSFVA